MVSLRNDIVSFRFWGYRGDLRIELQAPVFIHKAWSLNSKIALQHRKIRSRLLPMYIRSNRKKFGGKRNNMRLSLFFLHCFGAQLHLLGCRCTTQFYHMTSRLWVITPCNKINKLLFLIGNSLREAVLSRKIHVQIMRVTSCLNMKPKLGPDLHACRFTRKRCGRDWSFRRCFRSRKRCTRIYDVVAT